MVIITAFSLRFYIPIVSEIFFSLTFKFSYSADISRFIVGTIFPEVLAVF